MENPLSNIAGAIDSRSRRNLERLTGGLLIVYGLLIVASVVTRVASQSDQETFSESIFSIMANQGLFLTSAITNLTSNILLIALAALLYLTLGRREPILSLVGAFVFLAAASVWLVSSASSLALWTLASGLAAEGSTAPLTAVGPGEGIAAGPAIELLRELTGKASFTLAALALLVFGGSISWRGVAPRWLGWLGIVAGLLMFFIWSDSAATLHRLGGGGYLLWLWFLGGWLILKGTRAATDS